MLLLSRNALNKPTYFNAISKIMKVLLQCWRFLVKQINYLEGTYSGAAYKTHFKTSTKGKKILFYFTIRLLL